MGYKYHAAMTDTEVKQALTEWLQRERYPLRTIGKVVYFSHDLMTGTTTVEMNFPLPDDEEEAAYDDHEDDYDLAHEDEYDEEDRQWDDIALSKLALTGRASALFKYLDVETVGEAYDKVLSKGPTLALRTPNMGKKTLRHMAYVIRKAMKGLVIDGVYYAPARAEFIDYIGKVYKLQFGIDEASEERNDE
jgi:hypothetical protein